MKRPPILVTSKDRDLLISLLRNSVSALEPAAAQFLREELDRADIAPDKASRMMVGMGCEVKFIDHGEQRLRTGRLVYPEEVEGGHCISVLSPIGSALIGLGPGQSISWVEDGIERTLTVLEVGQGHL
jgi:regulator of nucleoside diphosphate kinase